MTQETLEEAAESYSKRSSASVFQENHKKDFINGAKWQQERMYSEEDMEKAFKVGFSNGFASDVLSTEKLQKEKERLFCEWFEQFKKK
jgi:hypothetical protein